MRCSVCKTVKDNIVHAPAHSQWHATSQRTPLTGVRVLFKLYDLTKTEFESGFLCEVCFDLVVQIESLENQLKILVEQGSHFDRETAIDHLVEEQSDFDCSNPEFGSSQASHSDQVEDSEQLFNDKNLDNHDDQEDDDEYVPQPKRSRPKTQEITFHDTVIKQEEPTADDNVPINVKLSRLRKPTRFKARIYNTQADNLDFDVSLGKTTNKRDALIYQGYKFYQEGWRSRRNESNETMDVWRCRHKQCKSRVISYMNAQCVLKDTLVEHSHPPNTEVLLYAEFQEQIRRLVREHPDMPPDGIFTSAQMLCPDIIVAKTNAIMRNIRRLKKIRREELEGQQNEEIVVAPSLEICP